MLSNNYGTFNLFVTEDFSGPEIGELFVDISICGLAKTLKTQLDMSEDLSPLAP